jgi:FlaA1/EpsC-like NDP-sugar epimerase
MWIRSVSFRTSSASFDGVAMPSFGSILRQAAAQIWGWFSVPVRCSYRIIVLAAEVAAVLFSFILNLSIFDALLSQGRVSTGAWLLIPIVLLLRGGGLLAFGVWRRSFRYASVADIFAIGQAIATSSIVLYIAYRILESRLHVFLPGLLFVTDAITAFLLLCLLHFSMRLYKYQLTRTARSLVDSKRVVVVGAGDAAACVLHELASAPESGISPVALVDDDTTKEGMCIQGVQVVGSIANLSEVVLKYRASEVLVCIPSASERQTRRILAACLECGVPIRALPSVTECVNCRASWRELRSIRIEDVLQRKPFVPDRSITRNLVAGRVVLVTGAGGSIGSELSRQIAAAGPSRLILVDKSENSLFYIHSSIAETFPEVDAVPVLADIVDQYLVHDLFERERPHLVFHAAAFKHVGMMEMHPEQAIRNNVLGTRNVLLSAVKGGIQSFVNISTDKAVNPRSYMGLSKKLTELMVKEAAWRYGAPCMNVRFGNVAGSSGSVIKIFSERITSGKPLRVTDPRATRYFMSIPEAVYLILCAATLGRGGETFILDMGAPVNIYELARTVSLFSGLVPGEDLPIQFTGLREGEKIHEELWEESERPQPTVNRQIFELKGGDPLPADVLDTVRRLEEFLSDRNFSGMLDYIDQSLPHFTHNRPLSPIRHELSHSESARMAQ